MAFFNSSCMLTFIILATLLFVNAFAIRIEKKVTLIELGKICSQTWNYKLCVRTLRRDPRTATADVRALSGISIDVAILSVKSTTKLLATLVINARTVGLKERYLQCSKNYGVALRDLNRAKFAFAKKDFDRMGIRIGEAIEGLESCRDGFDVRLVEPSQLQNKNDDDIDLAFNAYFIGVRVPRTV